jgi:signal transduction histidine kinase
VRNLLQNAVVHGAARTVTFHVEAREGGVRITIVDDGRGVPLESFDALGQPFARAGQTGGTGVGLFVCGQLIARMHGALRFMRPSGAGQGLTVVLDLPGGR